MKYFPNGGGSIFTFEIKGMQRKHKSLLDQLKAVLTALQM